MPHTSGSYRLVLRSPVHRPNWSLYRQGHHHMPWSAAVQFAICTSPHPTLSLPTTPFTTQIHAQASKVPATGSSTCYIFPVDTFAKILRVSMSAGLVRGSDLVSSSSVNFILYCSFDNSSHTAFITLFTFSYFQFHRSLCTAVVVFGLYLFLKHHLLLWRRLFGSEGYAKKSSEHFLHILLDIQCFQVTTVGRYQCGSEVPCLHWSPGRSMKRSTKNAHISAHINDFPF
ncbi:hypothetical protein EDB19DRAFT_1725055 [Suillus lakei]|nr:hypothetical protein EDB19DRAFT_1725055 [Suillus lakei]